MPEIHPSAIVDPAASIADDAVIGPFCVIEGPVVIASGCVLYQSVYISGDTRLGPGCVVHPFCSIGHVPQDHSFTPATASSVIIGSGCELREGVTIHRGASEGTATVLGNNVYMMAYSHAAHNCVIEDAAILANGVLAAGYVHIGERAFLSGNVAVHQHVRIGRYAMISASSFVNKDIPPFCIAHKVPAVVAGLNTVGMRRGGMQQNERNEVKEAYKVLYRSGLSVSSALQKLENTGGRYALEFVEFVRASKRGVTRARRDSDESCT